MFWKAKARKSAAVIGIKVIMSPLEGVRGARLPIAWTKLKKANYGVRALSFSHDSQFTIHDSFPFIPKCT